jgi:hypothetical protein
MGSINGSINNITVPASQLVGDVTMMINVSGVRAAQVRLWIGLRLIRLAARIIGCRLEVDGEVKS